MDLWHFFDLGPGHKYSHFPTRGRRLLGSSPLLSHYSLEMSSTTNKRKLNHDMNVPLSSTSRSKSHEANIYQNRLSQLKYHELAFCHTAYGRLKLDKDDADYALPWDDLLASSTSSYKHSNRSSGVVEDGKKRTSLFGRTNSLGMKVYRRLNIVVEEVSDVSRLLLPTNENDDEPEKRVSKLLQKYDIISIQPMNEPTLQNICELLESSSHHASSLNKNNNTHFIDIILLEYATGSRGGYSLPYKLRKEYLMKALESGVTFELWYVFLI